MTRWIPDIGMDGWQSIMEFLPTASDAARAALLCTSANQALQECTWSRTVRVSVNGKVHPPLVAAGFHAIVAPGQDAQAAVKSCPSNGSVLLLAGEHEGPLVAVKGVHVFGEGGGKTVLRAHAARGGALVCHHKGSSSALVDVVLRDSSPKPKRPLVFIKCGGVRVQGCDLQSRFGTCIHVSTGRSTIAGCRMHDSRVGVVALAPSRPTLVDCTVTRMSETGLHLESACTTLVRSHITDGVWLGWHAKVSGTNTVGDLAGPGREEAERHGEHAAKLPEFAAAYAALLDVARKQELPVVPEPTRFDIAMEPCEGSRLLRCLNFRREQQETVNVILRPGVYEMSFFAESLHRLRSGSLQIFGRGQATIRFNDVNTLIVWSMNHASIVFDGVRFEQSRKNDDDNDDATLSVKWGSVQLQACSFVGPATSFAASNQATVKAIACRFEGAVAIEPAMLAAETSCMLGCTLREGAISGAAGAGLILKNNVFVN